MGQARNATRSTFSRSMAGSALAVIGVLWACHAQAQTWEYKSYKRDRNSTGGQYSKDNFVLGTISVEEKDGKAYFRMVAGAVDVCYRGALPVTVTKSEATTVIEVEQAVSGCEVFRYTINNDGTGGFKEVKVGDRWAKSRFDHGLTPVK